MRRLRDLEPAGRARPIKQKLRDELPEQITDERDLVMIGSQVIHAAATDVPAEVVMSRECDLPFDESDPVAGAIEASLGPAIDQTDDDACTVWV